MNPVYVIAINYQHYRDWVDTIAEPRRKYIYVASVSALRGASITHTNVIWLPGSYTRPDAAALESYCAKARAVTDAAMEDAK